MGIQGTSRVDGKALVEIADEFWQISIAVGQAGNLTQPHLLDQAVLQGLVDAFDASFGLRRVGTDDLNVQFLHGPPKLRQSLPGAGGGHIHPKNTVSVAVEGHRLATAPKIIFCGLSIAEKALAFHEAQLYQLSRRIVNEN